MSKQGFQRILLQALVSSGSYTADDFSSGDVQPSELCSLPVPRRFDDLYCLAGLLTIYAGLLTIRKCYFHDRTIREIS
jgi:hypothetical protein